MDAEKQRTASEKEHLARSAAFSAAEARVKALEKKLSRYNIKEDLERSAAVSAAEARVKALEKKLSR